MVNINALFAATVAAAASSESDMFDDGVSLLQMRAHKHDVQEEPEFYVGDVNTLCPDDEIITFAKCLQAQFNSDIFKQMLHGLQSTARRWGMAPIGCNIDQANRFFYNDEPLDQSRINSRNRPICQRGGGGGRIAELAQQKISCSKDSREGVVEGMMLAGHADGCDPDGFVVAKGGANINSRRLTWADSSSVVVPELTLGAKGGVCEDTCALLTYEQCTRASDSGMLEQLTGYTGGWNRFAPISQHFGFNHAPGSMPSGCSWSGRDTFYFNPLDTPSAINAGPGGEPWVTPTGVGVGWNQVAPICGKCTTTTPTTTTTSTEPPAELPPIDEVGDDAAAVADPHMQTSSGGKYDLASLYAVDEDQDQRPENMCRTGTNVQNICYARSCSRTGQRPGGRNCAGLPGGANACCKTRIQKQCTGPNMDRCRIKGSMGMGSMGMGSMGMGSMGMGKMGGKMGMGMGMGMGNDEAEAVGDPHLTISGGEKADLCCEGGECHACPPQ